MHPGSAVPPIRHCVTIAAPPSSVFAAIATGEAWDRWYTKGAQLEPSVGGVIELRFSPDGPYPSDYSARGSIVAYEPDSLLAFEWGKFPKHSHIEIHVEPVDEGAASLVTLFDVGYRLTDDTLPVILSCAAGWGEMLTLLKFWVEIQATYRRG